MASDGFDAGADLYDASWEEPAVPRAVPWVGLVLALLGLGISVYLTVEHFQGVTPSCPATGIINCAKVTTSAQSRLFGVPVALLGLIYYVVVTGVHLPPLWRSTNRMVAWARVVLAAGGMAFVIYLLVAELLIIGNICLWCTGVHIITFALFVLVMATAPALLSRTGGWDEGWDEHEQQPAGGGTPTAPAGSS